MSFILGWSSGKPGTRGTKTQNFLNSSCQRAKNCPGEAKGCNFASPPLSQKIITWPLVPLKNFAFENLNFGNPCVRICKIVFAAAWGAAGSLDTWSWSGHGTLSRGLCKHSVYKYNFQNWTNTFWSWRNKTTLRSILWGRHWYIANQWYELWINDDIHDNNCTKKMFTFFKSS